jgi:hypothetical protein
MDDISGPTFICDPPATDCFVITFPHKMTSEDRARMMAAWEEYKSQPAGAVLVMDAGTEIHPLGPPSAWPDAEYCAA